MPRIDDYANEVPTAFDKGRLKSLASKAELAKFKAAARGPRSRIAASTSGCPLAT
jgi:hypothetical protein